MNKIRLLQLCAILCGVVFTSCREEFNDHYESLGNSTIEKNIIQILRENPDFSLFTAIIDRLDLASTLGESAIYTCLAERDKDVQTWLNQKGYASVEAVPINELKIWLNYHLILGMRYKYDLEKKTKESKPEDRTFYTSCGYRTRTDALNPGKRIRFYNPAFLAERADDYRYLQNHDADGFTVEGVKVSDQNDIDAANGVIHILDAPLYVLPRADEAIAADTTLSIASHWLDKYVIYSIKGADDWGKIDTTKIKSYNLGANLADESGSYTFIIPTNKAIRKFFGKYIAENFDNEYDSIPKSLIGPILTNGITSSYWGMSDIVREGGMTFVSITFGRPFVINDILGSYAGGVPSSNLDIYKMDELLMPPVLNSVEGGIYMNQKRYKEWGKMMAKGLNAGLTDVLQYNHSPRTLLVQPDAIWTKFVEDYQKEQLDTLLWSLGSGIINQTVEDGKFENRYYLTSYGALLYDNGRFTDYTGKTVKLTSTKSTWDGANGSIYEIDGFLNPLLNGDTTQNIYKLQIAGSETYALFDIACRLTGMSEKLKEVGYFNYTIFAPTDEAFRTAGIEDLSMPIEELKELVERHIIKRKIFTDGKFISESASQGRIDNMAGEMLQLSGAWDTFSVTDASGQTVNMLSGQVNKQANNGVLHGISKILLKKQ